MITKDNEVRVFLEICREGAVIPQYKNHGDAGMDVYSIENVIIHPGETVILATGLKFAIPEGYEIQVRPRSGMSYNTPLRISNSPGTIDCGYRDEMGIIMTNTSPENSKEAVLSISAKSNQKGSYEINKGDRIAQIVLQRVPFMKFEVVESVRELGNNRGGGFGSTGIR